MNQGKLKVVKQEMARVNVDILGSSELKWTGMGEFNSDDYYIYYCGQESLRRNGVAIIVNKRVQNAVLGCNLKNDRMISDQGKLEVVKQEMARVNVDILGISELKWTRMGEFNSDDHCIYYCGQESLRRNGVAIMVNKRVLKCSTWMQSQKRQNDLGSFPRQTIQYHSNPSLCPNQ